METKSEKNYSHVELGRQIYGWAIAHDYHYALVIPNYNIESKDYLPAVKEMIASILPKEGEKVYKWLTAESFVTRSLVLEDKTITIETDGPGRLLIIENGDL